MVSIRRSLPWLATLLLLGALFSAPALAKKEKKKKGATRAVVSGVVQDTAGKKLRDVAVVLASPDGETVAKTATDKKGEFEIEIEDGSGSYRVTFSTVGYSDFTGEVQLIPGEQQSLDVKLLNAEEGKKNEAIAAYNAAAELHRNRDLDKALSQFQRAAEMDPQLAPAFLGIADVHLQQGNVEAAVEAAERFLELEPDDEQGKKVAFEAYRRAGLMDKAKAVAGDTDSEELTQDMAIGIYNEGALASQQGNYELALAKFQEAAEIRPEMAQAHAGIASIFYNQEKLDEALASVDKALGVEPDNRQALRIQYLSLDAKGEVQKALDVWDAYRAIDADGAIDLLYRRADMDFQGGDTAAAQQALRKILEARPDFARAHYTLGLTYTSTDAAKAKEHLQKFIDMAPDDPEVPAAQEILSYL